MMTGKRAVKLIICLLCAALLPALCACSREERPTLSEGRLNIVCTVFPAYDFAREIAGDRANVLLLIPPGAESHSFEPTPQDMAALAGCDLIFANGGVGESWLTSLITAGETDAAVIYMTECVPLRAEEHKEGMQSAGHSHEHDDSCHHDHEHHDEEYDEHVWTSPVNAIEICRALSRELCRLDGAGRDEYTARTLAYTRKLEQLHERFELLAESSPHKTMVFADRFPVRYFVEEYGFDYYAAFPGCAEETEPSARTVAFLIDKVRQEELTAVFYIEFSNEKMADVIVEDTGCKKLLFHSCHTVGADELEAGISYLQLMEQNYVSLKEGLS